MVFLCHVIMQNQVTEGLTNFLGRVFRIALMIRGEMKNLAECNIFVGW